jgi:hypothetical protein
MNDPLVSVSAAARTIGVRQSTLSRQIKAGSIRSHGGKVRVSEVLADRKNNIDSSRWNDRKKRSEPRKPRPMHTKQSKSDDASLRDMHEALDSLPVNDIGDADQIEFDERLMSVGRARMMRETYLARLAQMEFESASGQASAAWRDRWLSWAPRAAAMIARDLGIDQHKLVEALEDHVNRELAEASPACNYQEYGADCEQVAASSGRRSVKNAGAAGPVRNPKGELNQ